MDIDWTNILGRKEVSRGFEENKRILERESVKAWPKEHNSVVSKGNEG
jgi:hypothetical protein